MMIFFSRLRTTRLILFYDCFITDLLSLRSGKYFFPPHFLKPVHR